MDRPLCRGQRRVGLYGLSGIRRGPGGSPEPLWRTARMAGARGPVTGPSHGGPRRPPMAPGADTSRRAGGTTMRSRMARGKHSPALFEVVHGKKHVDKNTRTGALRTPNWWFKGRERLPDTEPSAPATADTSTSVADDEPSGPSADDPTANASALTLRGRETREQRERTVRETPEVP